MFYIGRPHVVPGGPAHGELLIHNSLEPLLAERFDTLLLLLLELLFHLALHLCLKTLALNHRISRLLELLSQLGVLSLDPAHLFIAPHKLLLVCQEVLELHLGLPPSLPLLIRGDELWLHQACAGLLEQVALFHIGRPHVVPDGPAHRELLVHDSLEPLLAKGLDTLLLFLLELLLQQTLCLSLLTFAGNHCSACCLQLPRELVDLLLKLCHELSPLPCLSCEALLSRHGSSRRLQRAPVTIPVRVSCTELGLCHANPSLLEQVALATVLEPHVMPSRPAYRQLLID